MTEQDAAQTVIDALARTLDAQGPARLIKLQHAHDLVCAAIDEHAEAEQARSTARGPSRRRLALVLIVSSLVAGAAAAALWFVLFWRAQDSAVRQPESALSSGPAGTADTLLSEDVRTESATGSSVPAAPIASDAVRTEWPAAAASPSVSADEAGRPASAPSADEATPTATQGLLQRASALRRAGKLSEAERTYLQLIHLDSESISAYVAMAAVGSLRLAKDPAGALDIYRRAREVRPGGALEVEILSGMAQAHRRLGDIAGEARVLRELTVTYPQDAAAETARERLRALHSRP